MLTPESTASQLTLPHHRLKTFHQCSSRPSYNLALQCYLSHAVNYLYSGQLWLPLHLTSLRSMASNTPLTFPIQFVAHSHVSSQWGTCSSMLFLAWLAFLLRGWTRLVIRKNWGWDDTMMLFALVCNNTALN
jgi:hypothetical protein